MSANKQNTFTFIQKYEIVKEIEGKYSKTEIAHGIRYSQIVNAFEREGRNVTAKSLKGSTHSDLEKAVFDWFCQHRA
ncbi:hypothetical protein PR048_020127 [Dryococelus australis]|uniref:Uncharacterized protein n=1 Tax=Dryococelus australis TaxID=614101 RepID=A0ABQ9H5G2_9NEOP|nr:hypothetical protein PR048_020127 [Dryococelus australis]